MIIIFIIMLVLFLAGVYYFFIYSNPSYPSYASSELTSITTHNAIFAFDLHGVVLKPNIGKIIQYMWYELEKTDFLLLILNPIFWPFLLYISQVKFHTEATFTNLVKKIPFLAPFKDVYIHILSMQRLNQHMIDIMLILKKNSYHLYALSNIWPSALHRLRYQHPLLDDIFIDYFIPENLEYSSKPKKKFYDDFKRFIMNQEGIKNIIFIDDRVDNVIAAWQCGLYAFPATSIDNLIEKMGLIKQKI